MDLSSMMLFKLDSDHLKPPVSADKPTVVIDLGTRHTKVGYAREYAPTAVFPTVEAQMCCQQVQLLGKENHQDCMELVLNHIFSVKLGIQSSEFPVLLGRSLPHASKDKEKTVEILFEKFKVPRAFLALNNALSLYSVGHMSGVVMELGAGSSYCVALHEGYPMLGHIVSSDITGNKLTEYFMNLMSKRENPVNPVTDPVIAEYLKENVCSVAPNLFSALHDPPEMTFELPDGNMINIGKERFQCPEAMFNPNLIPSFTNNIPKTICECVKRVEKLHGQSRALKLLSNVWLTGGSSKFTKLGERVKDEMDKILGEPYSSQTKVRVCPAGGNSAWIGGSLVCCQDVFKDLCINEEEYREQGPSIVHSKTF